MQEKTINFKKQRELGDIITDTFKFTRENFKPLSKALVTNVSPVFLLLIAATVYYNYSTLGSLASGEIFVTLDTGIGIGNLLISVLIMFVGVLVYYSMLYSTVYNYIKFYMRDRHNIDQKGISQAVQADFWRLLGLSVITSTILIFGFLLCFFPGIYIMVPLSLVFAIAVFENKNVAESISYSFNLIKDSWWTTFATVVVFAILLYIISLIFQLPVFLYTFMKAFTVTNEISAGDNATMFDGVYIALTVVSNIFQYILYTFFVIMAALIYFNLNEQKNFTGTIETINSIGSTVNTADDNQKNVTEL